MIKHLLAVNWVRIWAKHCIPAWESLHSWNYELDYKILRCDGFMAFKNNMTGSFRFMFLELDRGTNEFDKVIKYNKLYESDKYINDWWVKLTDHFPPILIVTVDDNRKKAIQGIVEGQNINGLEFRVKLLDEIKREVIK